MMEAHYGSAYHLSMTPWLLLLALVHTHSTSGQDFSKELKPNQLLAVRAQKLRLTTIPKDMSTRQGTSQLEETNCLIISQGLQI